MKLRSQLRALGFLALCLAARPAATRAALTTTDQQNTTFDNTSGGFSGTATTGFGQSFTPALLTLNAATFSLATEGASSTVRLRLFSGTGYGGTLLATSAAVTFTNTTLQTTEFDFATPVALAPGATYTLQLALPAGSSYVSVYSDANPYAGGLLYNASGNGFYRPRFGLRGRHQLGARSRALNVGAAGSGRRGPGHDTVPPPRGLMLFPGKSEAAAEAGSPVCAAGRYIRKGDTFFKFLSRIILTD